MSSERDKAINAILDRAIRDKKRVFGFSSLRASCGLVQNGLVPPEVDRLTVENDKEWTSIPTSEVIPCRERAKPKVRKYH